MSIGPRNKREEEALAKQEFVVDVQHRIQKLLNKHSISRADLAKKLGVSKPRVTRFLSDNPNVTLETLAGIFYALGERCVVTCEGLENGSRLEALRRESRGALVWTSEASSSVAQFNSPPTMAPEKSEYDVDPSPAPEASTRVA